MEITLDALQSLFVFILGLLFGSFANVLVARLPHGKSVVSPRSRCPQCETPIAWYDNIPLLSYAWLRGRCRSCRYGISIRYPVIELLTGVLFLAMKIRMGWSLTLFVRDLPLVVMLVAVTFIDLEHRIIPDILSLGGLVFGLATAFLKPDGFWVVALGGAALGFGLFYGLAVGYEKFTGRAGLGGGDVKLLAMLGSFVGPYGVIACIFISSILGSLVGVGWALARKEKDLMKVAIPYGPFLVVGALYYYLLGDVLWFQFMTPT